MKKVISLILLSLLFTGCASTKMLTNENHKKINSIYIADEVIVPEGAFYYGPEQGIGAIFGIAGALVSETAETKDELIVEYMKENDIDIGQICKEAVKNALINNPKFSDKKIISNLNDADTILTVEVFVFGISQTHGFSSVYGPLLGIKAKLTDKNENIVWQDYENVSPSSRDVNAIEFDEYFKDPNNMKIRYEQAAKEVGSLMSKDM